MASARQQVLQARRSSGYSTGTRLRVLSPAQTGLSSIAKQSAANETDIMISKYNAGLIGNEEMKAFLQNQLNNQYVSASDKTQIQTKLLDFDNLIAKDRLEATFKSAQENTSQKEQAAKALAQYYKDRASTMVAGTPAHSQALENAGAWDATALNIQQSVNKQYRKNLESKWLQDINQKTTGSSERYAETAKMYEGLYNSAMQQGDEVDAQRYLASMEQAKTKSDEEFVKELDKKSKSEIKQFIANQDLEISKLTDKTPEELKAKYDKAIAVANKYAEMGDQLNYTKYMTVATQAEEKFNKASAAATASATSSEWDKEDYQLSNALYLAQKFLQAGKTPDGQPYTPEDYKNDVTSVTLAKGKVLENRYQIIDQMAAEDPNQKVKFNGTNRRVEDVLAALSKEKATVDPQVAAIQSGNFAIKEVSPTESAKNPGGKPVSTLQIVDLNNIDMNEVARDSAGVLHDIQKEYAPIPLDQTENIYNNVFTDANGTQHKAKQLANGTWVAETGNQTVDTYEPGGTRKISIPYDVTKSPEENKFGPFSEAAYMSQGMKSLDTTAAQAVQDTVKKDQLAKTNMTAPVIPGTKPSLVGDTRTPLVATPTTAPAINISQSAGKINMPGLTQTSSPVKADLPTQTQIQPSPVQTSLPGLQMQQPKIAQSTPGLSIQTPVSKPITISAPSSAPAVNIGTTMPGLSVQKPVAPAPAPNLLQQAGNAVSGIGTKIKDAASGLLGKLKFW